jgi:hypothetical protein
MISICKSWASPQWLVTISKLQQAMQLASMHFRYSVTRTHLPAAHLYHLRRARMCALSHLQNSIESRIKEACNELRLSDTYPGPPPIPPSVQRAHKRNHCKSYTNWIKPKVNDRWHFLLSSSVPAHTNPADHSDLPLTSRAQAYHRIRFHAPKANLLQQPSYLTQYSPINAFLLLRVRMQCRIAPAHTPGS